MNLEINLDDDLYGKAEEVFFGYGLNFEIAVKSFLLKVVNEKSIAFLFDKPVLSTDHNAEERAAKQRQDSENYSNYRHNTIDYEDFDNEDNKMTKSRAIRLLRSQGFNLNGKYITFASKNKTAYNYWANPEFAALDKSWVLILNDNRREMIYLFDIPANAIAREQLMNRNDKPYIIDLQIRYNDNTFTDNRSGVSFAKYLVTKIGY